MDETSGIPAIVAFIPAFNEEGRVGDCVAGALTIPGIERVVVIDDCSTDATRVEALVAGATVIRLDRNVGKGGALMAGIGDTPFDYCLFLDADLGTTSEQGALLLAPVISGQADMTIARFPAPTRKAGFGKVKGLALQAIAAADPAFDCRAPLSGQRAMTRACLEAVLPLAEGYGVEVAMTVRALRAGMRVVEVETTMAHRQTGNDIAGILHRAAQYRDVKRAVAAL